MPHSQLLQCARRIYTSVKSATTHATLPTFAMCKTHLYIGQICNNACHTPNFCNVQDASIHRSNLQQRMPPSQLLQCARRIYTSVKSATTHATLPKLATC